MIKRDRIRRFALLVCALLTAISSGPIRGDESGAVRGGESGAVRGGETFGGVAELVQEAIRAGDLPGAVVCFASGSEVRYLQAFGDRQVLPRREPMTIDTVFDLASLTKPIATATSIMLLRQRGKLDVSQSVVTYLPEFASNGKDEITLRQCLLHTSGLTPDNSIADYEDGAVQAWQRICELPLRSEPGSKFAYSDVGFIVLGKVVERVSGQSLDQFTADNIYRPTAMNETGFNPPERLRDRAATSERRGEEWLRGKVHDPRAARLGGVAGHAGLFSTANDLVLFGQSLLAARQGNPALLTRETLKTMIQPRTVPRGTRTFGWDHRSPYSKNRGDSLSEAAFGHGGFTGTVMWVDPEKDLIFLFLSSRLHPDGEGTVNALAGKIVTGVGQRW